MASGPSSPACRPIFPWGPSSLSAPRCLSDPSPHPPPGRTCASLFLTILMPGLQDPAPCDGGRGTELPPHPPQHTRQTSVDAPGRWGGGTSTRPHPWALSTSTPPPPPYTFAWLSRPASSPGNPHPESSPVPTLPAPCLSVLTAPSGPQRILGTPASHCLTPGLAQDLPAAEDTAASPSWARSLRTGDALTLSSRWRVCIQPGPWPPSPPHGLPAPPLPLGMERQPGTLRPSGRRSLGSWDSCGDPSPTPRPQSWAE